MCRDRLCGWDTPVVSLSKEQLVAPIVGAHTTKAGLHQEEQNTPATGEPAGRELMSLSLTNKHT